MDYIDNEMLVNHEDQTIPFKGEWETEEIVLLSETSRFGKTNMLSLVCGVLRRK